MRVFLSENKPYIQDFDPRFTIITYTKTRQ